MKNIFGVTSRRTLGGTFVDWSIHYLSGQDSFYSVSEDRRLPITHNPLSKNINNSHLHPKNHPSGVVETLEYIHKFLNIKGSPGIFSLYPITLRSFLILKKLNITVNEVADPTNLQKINKYRAADFDKILKSFGDYGIPLVYIHQDECSIGQSWQHRSADFFQFSDDKPLDINDRVQEYFDVFFRENTKGMDIWDVREIRALDIRPFNFNITQPLIDFDHCWVNTSDLWTLTEDVLLDILKFLKLPINKYRLQEWQKISNKWKDMQNKSLRFFRNLDHILYYTVQGYSYDISDLTFEQEVIVQHMLIYKYNLNLKNWKLKKFPNNTKDLHKLLEPNTHIIEKIY